jgi:broad specificity phosphatase PhoE
MKVVLIPCAATEWREEGRLLGRVELSPGTDAEKQCEQWAAELQSVALAQIYYGPDELARETAQWVGQRLTIPTKRAAQLAEVDLGLWAGLTDQQLKSRYASAHRELRESPLNVSPPEGENLGDAEHRLYAFLTKQIKKNGVAAMGLVLRPISFAMLWRRLAGDEAPEVWEGVRNSTHPVVIDCTPDKPVSSGD